MKHRYGNAKTSLVLSEKAKQIYYGISLMSIYEYVTPDGLRYTYQIAYDPETNKMTADELNLELETLYDEWEKEGVIDEILEAEVAL